MADDRQRSGIGLGVIAAAGMNVILCDPALAAQEARAENIADEIVVTARRREESVRDVPAAVTALSGERLQELNATNFDDFATHVPGLSYQSNGTGQSFIVIRGVTTGGAQPNSATSVYIDDVPIGSSSSFGYARNVLDLNLFDLQRIEVLRGPQGTLYGANALGGLLKYVTNAPDLSGPAAQAEVELSSTRNADRPSYLGALAVNVPMVTDRLGIRADAIRQREAGFIDDPSRGLEGIGRSTFESYRVSLLGRPTPDISIRLTALNQKVSSNGIRTVDRDYLTQEPTSRRYDQTFLSDSPFSYQLGLYSGVLSWDLGPAEFSSITAYQDVDVLFEGDTSRTFAFLFGTGDTVAYHGVLENIVNKFTQEFRLVSSRNRVLEWIVGMYYTNENTRQSGGLFDDFDPNGLFFGLPLLTYDIPTRYREIAGYVNGTIHFTDRFDLTLGARYSYDRQRYQQNFIGLLTDPNNPFGVLTRGANSKENVTTYLFNPQYRFNDRHMIYARVSSGYRPGGPNYLALDVQGNPIGETSFDADTLWSYEVGIKGQLLNDRISYDIAAYHIDWSNIQLVVVRGGLSLIGNSNNAKITGVEAAFVIRPVDGLTLDASAVYTNARLGADDPDLDAEEGAPLPLSPRFAAAVTATYERPIRAGMTGVLSASYRFVGRRHAGFAGSAVRPDYILDAYNIVDLNAGLRFARDYEVNLFVKNLFNTEGPISADPVANAFNVNASVPVTIVRPRTIGVNLRASF